MKYRICEYQYGYLTGFVIQKKWLFRWKIVEGGSGVKVFKTIKEAEHYIKYTLCGPIIQPIQETEKILQEIKELMKRIKNENYD